MGKEPMAGIQDFDYTKAQDVFLKWDDPENLIYHDEDHEGHVHVVPSAHLRWVPKPEPEIAPRAKLLHGAVDAITRDRNNTYGPPTQDFTRAAAMLNAMGFQYGEYGIESIEPHHIAMIMIALKLSRLVWSPENEDSWMDIAGYAGCGWECVDDDTG